MSVEQSDTIARLRAANPVLVEEDRGRTVAAQVALARILDDPATQPDSQRRERAGRRRSRRGVVGRAPGRNPRGLRRGVRATVTAVPVLVTIIVAVAVAAVALTALRHHHASTGVPSSAGRAARNGKIALVESPIGAATPVQGQPSYVNAGLQLVNPDGSGRRPGGAYACNSLDECQVRALAWSPGGKRLAYLAGVARVTHLSSMTLYLVGADGQHPRRLAACGDCSGVSWSPDGSQIAVSRYTGGADWLKGAWNVWVINAKTGAWRRVTDCQPHPCYTFAPQGLTPSNDGPQWSPNGQAILFGLYRKVLDGSLDTVRPDGSHLTKLATVPLNADPQWSPDGRQIAFGKNNGIYIVNADGTGLRLLVARGAAPSWSPDGTRLVYSTLPPGGGGARTQLWVINADGSQNRLLYRAACCNAQIWSPDGKQIAFSPNHGRTDVINANGTDLDHIGQITPELVWQPIR